MCFYFAGNWDNSELKRFIGSLTMENMDLQPNLALPMLEFEEKVDIDDLVLPPKPMKMVETEISDIIQEPLEEKNKHAVLELDFYVRKEI